MPLRVRCRCGQELEVRYSEWVYILLGVALLALLLNTLAVVLLYFRLDRLASARAGTLPVAAVERTPAPSGGEVARPPAETAPAAARSAPPPSPGESNPAPPQGESTALALGPRGPGTPLPPVAAPAGAPSPGGSERRESPIDLQLKEAIHAVEAAPAGAPGRGIAASLSSGGPLACLLLLAHLEPEASARLASALLGDGDPRLVESALRRLEGLDAKLRARLAEDPVHRQIWRGAKEILEKRPLGRDLLELAAARDGDKEAGAAGVDPLGPELRSACRGALERKDLRAFREQIEALAQSGLDLALIVDVSQSMSGCVEALAREGSWFLPALAWAFPGSRVGAVFYRDTVEGTLDFTLAPQLETLRALHELKPEGGGDVPEGAHLGIQSALSMGVLRWRDGASKQLVLVGDAPPPHAEKEALLALLRRACSEGGYHLNALGLRPEEGRSDVPSFPDLARAGCGRSVTLPDPSRLGEEVFLAVFSDEARAVAAAILPSARSLFQ